MYFSFAIRYLFECFLYELFQDEMNGVSECRMNVGSLNTVGLYTRKGHKLQSQ